MLTLIRKVFLIDIYQNYLQFINIILIDMG